MHHAELRYADATPGEHDMTLEVGGAEQVTTTFTGTVTVGADGLSGTFTGADDGGTPVSGTFACVRPVSGARLYPPACSFAPSERRWTAGVGR